MNDHKILSAISYFSVFFAPFLVPLIIYFVAKDDDVKYHSKRAFLSHVITVILAILLFFGVIISSVLENGMSTMGTLFMVGLFILYGLINLVVIIWNVIQGVKVIR